MVPVFVAINSPVQAVDIESFMKTNCTSCHQDEVYKKQKKGLKDLGDLETQLHRCFSAIKIEVDLETEYALMDHLNKKFYHFPEDESLAKR